jgi:hypothetical protein
MPLKIWSVTEVVRGLARNPAAPVDVLLRLLEADPRAAAAGLTKRRDLPLPVQEAMLRHPLRLVRRTLAEHPAIDGEVRGRLLAGEDWMVATGALGRPGQPPLTDDVLSRLLSRIEDDPGELHTREELLSELADAMWWYQRVAAGHSDPRIRHRAASVAPWLDEAARAALLADPVPEIRVTAAAAVAEEQRVMQSADLPERHCHGTWVILQRPLSRALVDQVVAGGNESELYFVGPNPTTPPDVVEALLNHPNARVRRRLTGRADLTPAQLQQLAADTDAGVRTAVSVHPRLTEEQRAAIAVDVTTAEGNGHYGPRLLCRDDGHALADERVPVLADALRWARSVNPLLRRRAARHPGLPADLVAVLAGDPDEGVRVLLAQNHPGAPPALLLRSYLEYTGCGRDRLTGLPQFPVEGLAGLGVPRLAALDPAAPGALIERLLGDPDPAVRRLMAACPRLPVARIEALLDDAELAECAVANPALPAERMARIVQEAGS